MVDKLRLLRLNLESKHLLMKICHLLLKEPTLSLLLWASSRWDEPKCPKAVCE